MQGGGLEPEERDLTRTYTRRISKTKQEQVEQQVKLYNKQEQARAITRTRTRVKQEQNKEQMYTSKRRIN